MILGRYKITYDNGMVQEKDLISHSDYEAVKDSYRGVESLGEFFTDQSPMFDAIETGIIKHFGGESPIKIEKI